MSRLRVPKPLRRTGSVDDAGVSLVELTVVMLLTTVLGAMIVTTFLQGTNAVYAADARAVATERTKVATEDLTRALRLAVDPDGVGPLTPFTTASPYDVTFYAADGTKATALTGAVPSLAADGAPRKVRIWLDGTGTLRRTDVLPSTTGGVTSWPGTGTTRLLTRDVVTGSLPLFTFLATGDRGTDSRGVAVTSLANTAGTVTGVTALKAIQAVEVWVSLRNDQSKTGETTTAVSRVTLLNS